MLLMNNPRGGNSLPCIGRQEWVGLPALGMPWLKAKVDTGAKTSALHASNIEFFERDGREYVRFNVHPWQKDPEAALMTEAELVDQRHVRSSAGRQTFRPVIRTVLEIAGTSFTAEITLICRKKMQFRMLIGREALSDRFLVDTGRSYLGGKRKKKSKRKD